MHEWWWPWLFTNNFVRNSFWTRIIWTNGMQDYKFMLLLLPPTQLVAACSVVSYLPFLSSCLHPLIWNFRKYTRPRAQICQYEPETQLSDALAQICPSSGTVHKLCFSAAGGKAAYGNGASFSLPAVVFCSTSSNWLCLWRAKNEAYITYLLM